MSGSKRQAYLPALLVQKARPLGLVLVFGTLLSSGVHAEAPGNSRGAVMERALQKYNEAREIQGKDAVGAGALYRESISLLQSQQAGLSRLNRYGVLNLAALLLASGKTKQATELLAELQTSVEVLNLRGRFPKAVAHNLIQAQRALKDGKGPTLRSLQTMGATKLTEPDAHTGLSTAETAVLKSYLAAFRLQRHTRAVRARTYPGRQLDTVQLLEDLLRISPPAEAGSLRVLRQRFAPEPGLHRFGKGLLFFDIGPAISNRWTPAVTSLSLCSAFPYMDVVGLDLPDEVTTFLERVSPRVQDSVRMHPRFHILSGDGTKSLTEQLSDTKRLPLTDRAPPRLSAGMPVIVRSSNAIDIYFPWSVIGPALQKMADDFESNPLLILFNRSILFKSAGTRQLRLIGRLSKRGFWHNSLRFDASGEPSYVLTGFFPGAGLE